MKRRDMILGACAASWLLPNLASAQTGPLDWLDWMNSSDFSGGEKFPNRGRTLALDDSELASPYEMKDIRPWVQIMRTFGDPVFEGHFAIRVNLQSGGLCMIMWDRGDRVLGLAQFDAQPLDRLWPVLSAVMARRPEIGVGLFREPKEGDLFEAAHWRLDEKLAKRFGRDESATTTRVGKWTKPSKQVAKSIEPLARFLSPPEREMKYILWSEPAPLLDLGYELAPAYQFGSNEMKSSQAFDQTLMSCWRLGRMICEVPPEAAREMLARNTGPSLIPLKNQAGEIFGRARILTT